MAAEHVTQAEEGISAISDSRQQRHLSLSDILVHRDCLVNLQRLLVRSDQRSLECCSTREYAICNSGCAENVQCDSFALMVGARYPDLRRLVHCTRIQSLIPANFALRYIAQIRGHREICRLIRGIVAMSCLPGGSRYHTNVSITSEPTGTSSSSAGRSCMSTELATAVSGALIGVASIFKSLQTVGGLDARHRLADLFESRSSSGANPSAAESHQSRSVVVPDSDSDMHGFIPSHESDSHELTQASSALRLVLDQCRPFSTWTEVAHQSADRVGRAAASGARQDALGQFREVSIVPSPPDLLRLPFVASVREGLPSDSTGSLKGAGKGKSDNGGSSTSTAWQWFAPQSHGHESEWLRMVRLNNSGKTQLELLTGPDTWDQSVDLPEELLDSGDACPASSPPAMRLTTDWVTRVASAQEDIGSVTELLRRHEESEQLIQQHQTHVCEAWSKFCCTYTTCFRCGDCLRSIFPLITWMIVGMQFLWSGSRTMCLQGYLRQVAALEGRTSIYGVLQQQDTSIPDNADKWCGSNYFMFMYSQEEFASATAHLAHYRQTDWALAAAIASTALAIVPILTGLVLCMGCCNPSDEAGDALRTRESHQRRRRLEIHGYGTAAEHPLLLDGKIDAGVLPWRHACMQAWLNCVMCVPAPTQFVSDQDRFDWQAWNDLEDWKDGGNSYNNRLFWLNPEAYGAVSSAMIMVLHTTVGGLLAVWTWEHDMNMPIKSAVGDKSAPPVPWASIGFTGWVLVGCCLTMLTHWASMTVLQLCRMKRKAKHRGMARFLPALHSPTTWMLIGLASIFGSCGSVMVRAAGAAGNLTPAVLNHQLNVCVGSCLVGIGAVLTCRSIGIVLVSLRTDRCSASTECLVQGTGRMCLYLLLRSDIAGFRSGTDGMNWRDVETISNAAIGEGTAGIAHVLLSLVWLSSKHHWVLAKGRVITLGLLLAVAFMALLGTHCTIYMQSHRKQEDDLADKVQQ